MTPRPSGRTDTRQTLAAESPNRRGAPRLIAVAPTAYVSGAERVLLDRLAAARDRGWTVRCLRPAASPVAEQLAGLDIPGVDIPELRLPDGSRLAATARLAARWLIAARRLRDESSAAEVVLVNGLTALPALRLARLIPTRPAEPSSVWLVHDVVVRGGYERLVRASAPAVDLAIAVSEPAAALPRLAGMETVVVSNGTAWPVDPVSLEQPDRIVGLNGLITSWKGQAVLLEAAALLGPDVIIELMGGVLPKDSGYLHQLEERAAAPDLAGRVRFTGHVEDPLERMRTWSVAVSASTSPEAGPLSVLEAMSLGLPTVATDHGGAKAVLNGTGILVPPADPEALAAAIGRLLEDDELRRLVAAETRSRVAASHTLDTSIERFLEEVARLAGPAGARR